MQAEVSEAQVPVSSKLKHELFKEKIRNHKPYGLLGIVASLCLLSLYLMLFHEFLRRVPPVYGLVLLGLLPLLLWPHWKATGKKYNWNAFLILKTYSVTSASCIFLMSSLDTGVSVETLGYIIYGFMVLNILEAIVFEYLLRKKDKLSKLNSVAGLFILISTPIWDGAYLIDDGQVHGLMYSSPALWIVAYTLWNLAFVYNLNKGRFFGLHSAVLTAPFILFLIYGPDLWFQARFLTLALYLTTYNTFYGYFYLNISTKEYYSDKLKNSLPLMSFCLASICIVNFLFTFI